MEHVRFYFWIFIFSLPALGFKPDLPLKMSIYDFSPWNRFDMALVTELEAVADSDYLVFPNGVAMPTPRSFHTVDVVPTAQAYLAPIGSECQTAVLSSVQAPALLSMLRSGYISKTLYDTVIKAGDIWKPSQIRMVVTWSEVPYEQAKRIFQNETPNDPSFPDEALKGRSNIPWHRVMGAGSPDVIQVEGTKEWVPKDVWDWEYKWPHHQPLRIVRSAMMVIVGQVYNPKEGKYEFEKMAWQKQGRFSNISDLDRNAFKATAEFSRLLSEKGALPGDYKDVYRALLGLLHYDAQQMGIGLNEFTIFGWSMDRRRLGLFERFFSGRRLTPERKAWFETNYPRASTQFLEKLPRTRRFEPGEPNTHHVVLSTLAQQEEHFSLVSFSERVRRVIRHSDNQLTPLQAQAVIDLYNQELRPLLDVQIEGYPDPGGPIIVRDITPTLGTLIAQVLYDFGLKDDDSGSRVIQYLSENLHWEADTSAFYWVDKPLITPMPSKATGVMKTLFETIDYTIEDQIELLGPHIHNISEEAAKRDPENYLLTILLGVYDYYVDKLNQGGGVQRYNLYAAVHEVRAKKGLEPIVLPDYWDPNIALSEYTFVVATSSDFIAEHYERLGAKRKKASGLNLTNLRLVYDPEKLKSGDVNVQVDAGIAPADGWLLIFTQDDILRLKKAHAALKIAGILTPGRYQRVYQRILRAGF